jgi:hypothetical protein
MDATMAKSGKKASTPPGADAPMQKAVEGLTQYDLYMIADTVRKGKADALQARRLIEVFCASVDADVPPDRWLLLHLRDSFRCYLDEKARGMESAFGLKRRKGRPAAAEDKRIQMAADVLRRRLKGVSHQDALAQVPGADSLVGTAFAEHLLDAVALLRNERPNGFTPEEKARLSDIIDKRQSEMRRALALGEKSGG